MKWLKGILKILMVVGVVLHFKENFVDRPRRQKERMDADY